ncbi:MAG: hypothetical protein AAF624_15875, partial [Bacteroidota bacterium]
MTNVIIVLEIIILVAVLIGLRKEKYSNVRKVFIMWIVFGVILSLTPIIFAAIVMWLKDSSIKLHELWRQGELFLLGVAVGTAALGNLIAS